MKNISTRNTRNMTIISGPVNQIAATFVTNVNPRQLASKVTEHKAVVQFDESAGRFVLAVATPRAYAAKKAPIPEFTGRLTQLSYLGFIDGNVAAMDVQAGVNIDDAPVMLEGIASLQGVLKEYGLTELPLCRAENNESYLGTPDAAFRRIVVNGVPANNARLYKRGGTVELAISVGNRVLRTTLSLDGRSGQLKPFSWAEFCATGTKVKTLSRVGKNGIVAVSPLEGEGLMTNLLAFGKQARIVGKFDVARHGELIAYTGESFISQQTAKGRSYMRTTPYHQAQQGWRTGADLDIGLTT